MHRLIYALWLIPLTAFSQTIQPELYELPEGQDLRASPPSGGFFNFPGAVTGQTQTKPYVVLRDHQAQQGFQTTQWAEVAPVAPDGSLDQAAKGWVLLPDSQAFTKQLPRYEEELTETAKQKLQQELSRTID